MHCPTHCFFKKSARSIYGMTLLEMLLALGLFAFMSVFISQTLRQSYRHARKVGQDIQFKNSLSHVLSLIRKDLLSTAYLLDINANFNIHFPIEEMAEEEEKEEPAKKETAGKVEQRFPVFLNPLFIFEGSSSEMSFVSHSYSQKALDPSSPQWVRIRYSVQNCDLVEEGLLGKCLIRSVYHYWQSIEEREPEEQVVLFRAWDSLEFSYSGKKELLESEWKSEWEEEESPSRSEILPVLIKMEMTKKDRDNSLLFPVSQDLLRNWNPKSKAYLGFPKRKPPQPKKTEPSK